MRAADQPKARLRTTALMIALLTATAWAATPLGEAPELDWRATMNGEGMPEQVPAGYTLVTLTADWHSTDTLALFRLREGATLEGLQEASARIDDAFAAGEDLSAAINDVLELADMVAEVHSGPGDRVRVGVVLEEGDYVLEYGAVGGEAPMARSYHAFRVEGAGTAVAPEPDATVRLLDFGFELPPELPNGEQVWRVVNEGEQIHHMVIMRLEAGATIDDLRAWIETEGGEPPADAVGYIGVQGSGEAGYHRVFLGVGDYVAVCFMPDHRGDATGTPHVSLGMMQPFRVAGP